jgi:hypothetical protein
MVTADGGGSNGYRVRPWKVDLQKLSGELKLPITVCHLPPGTSKWNQAHRSGSTSKWNKIEHRLFSLISITWRGKPLSQLSHHRPADRGDHDGNRAQGACGVGLRDRRLASASAGLSSTAIAGRPTLAYIFAARSVTSSSRMPVAASNRSISSVASLTDRVDVSMVNSLAAGGW